MNSNVFAQDNGLFYHHWKMDSTVVFTYVDSTARRVMMESECLLPHEDLSFAGRHTRRAMKKIAPSVWQLTTSRKLSPELYTFRLFVDGKQQLSLKSYELIWKRNVQKHLFVLSGDAQSNLYLSLSPRGYLDTLSWSNADGDQLHAIVYRPFSYNDSTSYPVLYLLHGINGNQYDWLRQGRIAQILDNLIHQQRIEEVLVVMPRCLLSTPQSNVQVKATNVCNYGEILSGRFEDTFDDIHTYIQSHYTIRATGNAIAGLSCGARQAANIAHNDSCYFSYVGLFSPVVSRKQLPIASNEDMKYWVGACSHDWMFLGNAKRYVRQLQKTNIHPHYVEKIGGHTFRNWRIFITEFLIWAYPNDTRPIIVQ